MSRARTLGCLLTIFLLVGTASGCQSKQPVVNQPQYTTTPVSRSDVVRTVYAPGELVLTDTVKLSSPLDSKLLDLLVKPGAKVNKGDVLARLDSSEWSKEWNKQVKTLEDALSVAKNSLTAKKRAANKAGHQVNDKEFSVRQAELNVRTAKDNLDQIATVKSVRDTIANAEYALKFAKSMLAGQFGGGVQLVDYTYWSQLRAIAEEELAKAQKDLQDVLNGSSTKMSSDVALEVTKSQLQVEQSERALEDARIAVEDAKTSLDDASLDVARAEQSVRDSQNDLDEAIEDMEQALDRANIVAPFNGTVMNIKLNEGDKVIKDSPIIVLADLSRIKLMVTVGQDSIIPIKSGMTVDISLDALPGTTLKGKVDYIMPLKSTSSNTATYEIYLSLNDATEELLPGMSGSATIRTAEKHNVLRVPRRLVKLAPDGSGRVEVLEQGQPVTKEVVIGVKGDTYYEILSGVNEGDLVVQRGSF